MAIHWLDEGLSPRVRGNRVGNYEVHVRAGSIPASAGEPRLPCRIGHSISVYPRECGGTIKEGSLIGNMRGLSPRVRENRYQNLRRDIGQRSIPASAGEPWNGYRAGCMSEVYPRECGGTVRRTEMTMYQPGLSPRVRGNLCSVP